MLCLVKIYPSPLISMQGLAKIMPGRYALKKNKKTGKGVKRGCMCVEIITYLIVRLYAMRLLTLNGLEVD